MGKAWASLFSGEVVSSKSTTTLVGNSNNLRQQISTEIFVRNKQGVESAFKIVGRGDISFRETNEAVVIWGNLDGYEDGVVFYVANLTTGDKWASGDLNWRRDGERIVRVKRGGVLPAILLFQVVGLCISFGLFSDFMKTSPTLWVMPIVVVGVIMHMLMKKMISSLAKSDNNFISAVLNEVDSNGDFELTGDGPIFQLRKRLGVL